MKIGDFETDLPDKGIFLLIEVVDNKTIAGKLYLFTRMSLGKLVSLAIAAGLFSLVSPLGFGFVNDTVLALGAALTLNTVLHEVASAFAFIKLT